MRTRVELLLLYTMDYIKQPLDYFQILQMLKARGLTIGDDNDAIMHLKNIRHYILMDILRM